VAWALPAGRAVRGPGPGHPGEATGTGPPRPRHEPQQLAALLLLDGLYAKAEAALPAALAIREKALGPDHPEVRPAEQPRGAVPNLGRYDQRSRSTSGAGVREKALGADHPDVADSLNALARFYDAQGRYGRRSPVPARLQIEEGRWGATIRWWRAR